MEEKNKKDENFFNGFDDDILPDDFNDEGEGENKDPDGKGEKADPNAKPEDNAKSTGKEDGTKQETDAGAAGSEGEGKSQEELDAEAKAKAEQAEKNAKFAEDRRKREAEAKAKKEREEAEERIRKEATLKAELNSIKENPYTGEAISDAEDLEIYKIQKSLDDEGKDPVKDLPKRLAEIKREANKKASDEAKKSAEEEQRLKEQANKEVRELREKYPDLDTKKLADDPIWKEVFSEKAGRFSVTEMYELCYLPKVNSSKKPAEPNVNTEGAAKKTTTVPSSQSNGGKTSKNYLEMSDEEYLESEKKGSEDFFN